MALAVESLSPHAVDAAVVPDLDAVEFAAPPKHLSEDDGVPDAQVVPVPPDALAASAAPHLNGAAAVDGAVESAVVAAAVVAPVYVVVPPPDLLEIV